MFNCFKADFRAFVRLACVAAATAALYWLTGRWTDDPERLVAVIFGAFAFSNAIHVERLRMRLERDAADAGSR